jgi:hypothetical protein
VETYARVEDGQVAYFARLQNRPETETKAAEEHLAIGDLVVAEGIVAITAIPDLNLSINSNPNKSERNNPNGNNLILQEDLLYLQEQ